MKDFHKALKIEEHELGRSISWRVDFLAVTHQWGKTDFEYSLHAFPSQFGLSGLQTPDLLSLLGFQRRRCSFRTGQDCFSVEIRPGLELSKFPQAFDTAYRALTEAEGHLQKCGFQLPQREVWGHFTGRSTRRDTARQRPLRDGHSAAQIEQRNRAEDDAFVFSFSWMSSGPGEKGWVTHYRAKNQPVSAEVMHVFHLLGMRGFNECRFFDFEECQWTSFR